MAKWFLVYFILFSYTNIYAQSNIPTASFTASDTVCTNTAFSIVNASTFATTYNWNYCNTGSNAPVIAGNNLGNIGGNFSVPVFMNYVLDNGNYYGFVVNWQNSSLVRLDFGNSLLNIPTSIVINTQGQLPSLNGAEDIQLIKQNGKWFGFIVGGSPTVSNNPSVIIKIEFGASIINTTPTVTNWGNIGNMEQPHQLYMWQQNNIWYGFVFNAITNSLTRFDFTNSFNNTPTGVNLGTIGNLFYPSNFDVVNDNGTYRIFVTNTKNNTISRLDFGNSLLNTPTGINLGTLGGILSFPRGIRIENSCNEIYGYICNQTGNDITKIDFANNLLNTPTAISLGNIGNLNNPISFSKTFIIGNDKYFFVPNANTSNTISLLKFKGCNNSSIPNSTSATPPTVSYNAVGTYNINLTVDEGLPTQSSFCKKVVVVAGKKDSINKTICQGDIFAGYSVAGLYIDTFHLSTSCDSIRILNLTTLSFLKDSIYLSICKGENYKGFTTTGIYKDTLKSFTTCDTIRTINLMVNNLIKDSINKVICNGELFFGYTVSGIYKDTLKSFTTCDTIRTINLMVNNCNANPTCKGVIALHGQDKITPPTPVKKYIPSTGFTWETWFNSNYYDNGNTSLNTRNKLISLLDFPNCQDVVLGFGWPTVAEKNTLCFIADGPNGCGDRDLNPCKYFLPGGFISNTWYHVAAVRDYANNTSKLYFNGNLVDTKTNTHAPLNPTIIPGFIFGSWLGAGATDSGINGKMDEIKIWNYPRTDAEILTNYYKCLSGNETGLIAYYKSNEKSGTVLRDASINNNHATISAGVVLNKSDNAPIQNTCTLSSSYSETKIICQGDNYWSYTITGVFNDTLINKMGCDSFRTLNLTVNNYLKDSINISICNGENYKGFTVTGIYRDTVKSTTTCDSIKILNLTVRNNLNPLLLSDTSICEKDTLIISPGIFDFYLWNNGSVNKSINIKNVGTYWVTVSDLFRCKASDTFKLLAIHPRPKNFLPKNLLICAGEPFTLNGFVSYNWITGETTPTIYLQNLNIYSVKVTGYNNCIGIDSMQVNYIGEFNVIPLNAFSPNGDGINELFKPIVNNCITSYSLKIFDRSGQIVFETINSNVGWDGKFKGYPVPIGVYYYIINYKNLLGVENRKSGSLTLLR